jgi:hypothetical protein
MTKGGRGVRREVLQEGREILIALVGCDNHPMEREVGERKWGGGKETKRT